MFQMYIEIICADEEKSTNNNDVEKIINLKQDYNIVYNYVYVGRRRAVIIIIRAMLVKFIQLSARARSYIIYNIIICLDKYSYFFFFIYILSLGLGENFQPVYNDNSFRQKLIFGSKQKKKPLTLDYLFAVRIFDVQQIVKGDLCIYSLRGTTKRYRIFHED